jgi:hypothetical protein
LLMTILVCHLRIESFGTGFWIVARIIGAYPILYLWLSFAFNNCGKRLYIFREGVIGFCILRTHAVVSAVVSKLDVYLHPIVPVIALAD